MNEIFLDTETTGLSFKDGHKIVEIACIETKDLIPTGKIFHKLINPKRDIPEEAFKVHGFSNDFLKDKDTFDLIAEDFLNFIQNYDIMIVADCLQVEKENIQGLSNSGFVKANLIIKLPIK